MSDKISKAIDFLEQAKGFMEREPDKTYLLIGYALRALRESGADQKPLTMGELREMNEYTAGDVLLDCSTRITQLEAEVERVGRERDELADMLAHSESIMHFSCENPMRNMIGPIKGCDGNCQHPHGIPGTKEQVLSWMRGEEWWIETEEEEKSE